MEFTTPREADCWPAALDPAAFHGPLGELALRIEPESEADVAAILIQALVIFGNIVGHGPHFTVQGMRHSLNLFAALVGVTSKGRKGSSLAVVLQALTGVDRGLVGPHRVKSGLSSGEGLIWAVRDASEENPLAPK